MLVFFRKHKPDVCLPLIRLYRASACISPSVPLWHSDSPLLAQRKGVDDDVRQPFLLLPQARCRLPLVQSEGATGLHASRFLGADSTRKHLPRLQASRCLESAEFDMYGASHLPCTWVDPAHKGTWGRTGDIPFRKSPSYEPRCNQVLSNSCTPDARRTEPMQQRHLPTGPVKGCNDDVRQPLFALSVAETELGGSDKVASISTVTPPPVQSKGNSETSALNNVGWQYSPHRRRFRQTGRCPSLMGPC